jgi:hypothetical protein
MPSSTHRDVCIEGWRGRADFYISQALAASTQKLYSTGWRTFSKFMQLSGTPDVFKLSDDDRQKAMLAFVTYCVDNLHISYTTVKSYLCAIKYYFSRSGAPDPLSFSGGQPFSQLKLLLRGIRKVQGSPTQAREPVTIELLSSMVKILVKGLYGPYIDTLLIASFLVAFFGFLRCGEFTTLTDNFDPRFDFTMSDVTVLNSSGQTLLLHLSASKTDPYRKGVTIKLFPLHTHLCPIKAVTSFLVWRKKLAAHPLSPFFLLPSGTPLTRNSFFKIFAGSSTICRSSPAGYKATLLQNRGSNLRS